MLTFALTFTFTFIFALRINTIRCGSIITINLTLGNTRFSLEGYYPSYETLCYVEPRMKEGDSLTKLSHWTFKVDCNWDSDPKNIHRRRYEIKSRNS